MHRQCIQNLCHLWVTLLLYMTEDGIICLGKLCALFQWERPLFPCIAGVWNENKTRPESNAEVLMKCFGCPDISSEWTHTQASCSEYWNMPRVLDPTDKWTQSAVFYICTLLPTQCEVWYIEKSIVCTIQYLRSGGRLLENCCWVAFPFWPGRLTTTTR